MRTSDQSTFDEAAAEKYQCCELLTRFYRHLDRREYDELCSLMAADGTWRRRDGVTRAGDEMRATLSKRSKTLTIAHLLSNLMADILGPDHVTVRGYMTVYRDENGASSPTGARLTGPASIIGVEAECRRNGNRWQIAAIDNTWIFKA